MRKKGILLILALAGFFVSCNDAIDIKQPGEINDPYLVFKNAKDIKRAVSGVYASLPAESEIEFVSVFTDEIGIGLGNGGQGLINGQYGYLMQPGTSFAISTWASYYGIVNRINQYLEITEELIKKASVSERTNLNAQKAALLGLRAYSNLKLFSYYTPDYTNPSGLSIMKLDFVPAKGSLSEHIGRSTVKDIRDFILKDIDSAIDLRNTSEGWDSKDAGYLNQAVLEGLKVKLFSMTGEYDLLIPIANSLLTGGVYELATADEYLEMFMFDAPLTPPKEVMFKLLRPVGAGGGNVASAWYSSTVSKDGGYFYEMGRSLYNELDKLDPAETGKPNVIPDPNNDNIILRQFQRNDVRYSVNLLFEDSRVQEDYATLPQLQYVAKDILLIGKYKGRNGSGARLRNDIPIMRISDIALLLAEARAAKGAIAMTSSNVLNVIGDYSTVGNIIANIRFNRTLEPDVNPVIVPSITSVQSAWKVILEERRMEFAFEGHRYLDMKRLGVKAGSPGFDRYSKDCIVNGTCGGLAPTSHKLTLPIPVSEINANPIIRNQQNPGY